MHTSHPVNFGFFRAEARRLRRAEMEALDRRILRVLGRFIAGLGGWRGQRRLTGAGTGQG